MITYEEELRQVERHIENSSNISYVTVCKRDMIDEDDELDEDDLDILCDEINALENDEYDEDNEESESDEDESEENDEEDDEPDLDEEDYLNDEFSGDEYNPDTFYLQTVEELRNNGCTVTVTDNGRELIIDASDTEYDPDYHDYDED